jgi:hypothetical protein
MPKYLVIRDCYGFQGKYWEQERITDEIPEGVKVPEHFERIEGKKAAASASVKEQSFAEGTRAASLPSRQKSKGA